MQIDTIIDHMKQRYEISGPECMTCSPSCVIRAYEITSEDIIYNLLFTEKINTEVPITRIDIRTGTYTNNKGKPSQKERKEGLNELEKYIEERIIQPYMTHAKIQIISTYREDPHIESILVSKKKKQGKYSQHRPKQTEKAMNEQIDLETYARLQNYLEKANRLQGILE